VEKDLVKLMIKSNPL